MDNLLFCVLILVLLYYFFYYLPKKKRLNQSPPKLTHSQGTQTDDLTTRKINLLIEQWNQVAEWAKEEGVDVNKKWNLFTLKDKLTQKIKDLQNNQPDPQLENTLNNLLKDIQDLNKKLD